MRELSIKVCGLRDRENLDAVIELEPDFVGFILYDKSPRFFREGDLSSKYVQELRTVQKVGVFVNESIENIYLQAEELSLDVVQLHGEETPDFLEELKRALPKTKLWKVISVASTAPEFSHYEGLADSFLFDTASKLRGGSGTKFTWAVLDSYTGKTPYFLAGGISLGDEESLRAFSKAQSMCQGVDLNSGFESAPGVKDLGRLSSFIEGLSS